MGESGTDEAVGSWRRVAGGVVRLLDLWLMLGVCSLNESLLMPVLMHGRDNGMEGEGEV